MLLKLFIAAFLSIFSVTSILALLHISEIRKISNLGRVKQLFLVLIGEIVFCTLVGILFIFNVHHDVLNLLRRNPGTTDARLIANEQLWVDSSSNAHHFQGMWWIVSDERSGGASSIRFENTSRDVVRGKICVSGNVATSENGASEASWGAKLELSLCTNGSHESPPGKQFNVENCPRPIQGLMGFKMVLSGNVTSTLRIVFNETDRTDSAYLIAKLSNRLENYEFKEASVGNAPSAPGTNPRLVNSLSFLVVPNSQSSTHFDFCVSDLEPLFE